MAQVVPTTAGTFNALAMKANLVLPSSDCVNAINLLAPQQENNSAAEEGEVMYRFPPNAEDNTQPLLRAGLFPPQYSPTADTDPFFTQPKA